MAVSLPRPARPTRPTYPHPAWAQQDPADWRDALATVIRGCVAQAAIDPGDVATLALPTQVDGLVASMPTARPWRRPSSGSTDARPSRRSASATGWTTDAIRACTGLNLDASHVAPKIMWLREHHADVFERAAGLLLPGSALVAWLTGEHVVDHANASSTLLYDVTAQAWSPEMLDAADLDASRLGTIRPAAEVVGPLRPAAADGPRPDHRDPGHGRDRR